MIKKYFTIIVLVAVAAGFIWPVLGLWAAPYLSYFLMVMMFFSCLNISLADLKNTRQMWWRYLILMLFIFILPASVAFFFRGFLPKEIYAGLIVAAAVPSAISVVALTRILGGEEGKALVATTLAHLLAPVATPLAVLLFAGSVISIDYLYIAGLIAKLIFIPLLLAQIARLLGWQKSLNKFATGINLVLLVIIILGIVGPAQALARQNFWPLMIACGVVFFILLVEVVLAIWFGRTKKEDVTWAVVDTYKNFTLSSVIALQTFGPLAVLGSVAFSVLDNIIIAPLQWWARRK